MKIQHKMMLLIVVLFAFGLPMLIKGPNGRPMMTLDDWLPDKKIFNKSVSKIQSLGEKVSNLGDSGPSDRVIFATGDSPAVLSSSSGKMYKWQDSQGRWHFSNEKPQVETEVRVEALPEVKNLLPAPVVRRGSSSTMASPSSSPLIGGVPTGGLSISMDQAGQLLKNVEKISKDAEQRKALMDQ